MDINDQAILDRIERLAFQAGVNMAGAIPERQTQPKRSEVEQRLISNLKAIARETSGYTGPMWASCDGKHNIEWNDIYALLQENA